MLSAHFFAGREEKSSRKGAKPAKNSSFAPLHLCVRSTWVAGETRAESWRFKTPARARGFTLLEVLVVVAIIALLTAILLPSLKKVRAQAREVKCESNLRQIASAWQMYLQDSKGIFPSGVNMEVNYGGVQGKGSAAFGADPAKPVKKPLNQHLQLPLTIRSGGEVFACPDDRGTSAIRPTAIEYYGTSYYPNPFLIGQNSYFIPAGTPCDAVWDKVKKRITRVSRDRIDNETKLLLVGDLTWFDHWDPSPAMSGAFPHWHGRRCSQNVAFMDGHASPVRIRKAIQADENYRVIPFADLATEMLACQEEIPCP